MQNDRVQARFPRAAGPTGIMGVMGSLAIFASAFFFYFSTVVIRWSETAGHIAPAFFVFFRFLLGFFVICLWMALARRPLRPRRYHLLVGRCLANCVAVYCFYQAVVFTSVAEANILNMTYPVFVALLSWVLLRHQRDIVATLMVFVALSGVWMVLSPGRIGFRVDSLWGLCSGLFAAVSILYLNVSRQYHDSHTVLFYMFGLGTVVTYLLFFDRIFWPTPVIFFYLLACAAAGIAGQVLITIGFRYVTAVEGGVISSTRILLAAVMGPVFGVDPPLTWVGWFGACLIFGANVILTARKGGKGSNGQVSSSRR